MDLPALAKLAVETYILEERIIALVSVAQKLPPKFSKKKAGVFVTIKKGGGLRGCIGTYLPVYENIAEEVIHNAVTAATQDCRFGSIAPVELPKLSYAVYILDKPEPVKGLEELDPEEYGVIVKSENKCGLLLPGLEGVKTVEQQISIACQKGGIDLSKEKLSVYKFKVVKYD